MVVIVFIDLGEKIEMEVNKNRLEAFSDGVIAIIITIMVLEMQAPSGHNLKDLVDIIPTFVGYVLSFVFVATYWLSHHRLFAIIDKVNSKILWSNLHFMFWLSLIPFATSWASRNNSNKAPVIVYAIVILMSGLSYRLMVDFVIKKEGGNENIVNAFSKDKRGLYVRILNAIAIVSAFIHPNIAIFLLALVAMVNVFPDKKLNKAYEELLKTGKNSKNDPY